ncbi:MAG TPA: BrnT family toxin [Candidatus Yonathbacteria bacterium]|nr:BrnT family toxin [Candidatus Yonathbacteria bacterium]
MIDFSNISGFSWDKGNSGKNLLKHGVTDIECEEVFFNTLLLLSKDEKHSQKESRFHIIGKTNEKKHLFIVFTIRNTKIRIISARNMHKKEVTFYKNKN